MPRIIDSNDKNLIGDKVKALRKAKKMSQRPYLTDSKQWLSMYAGGSISRIEDKSRTVTDIELYGISKVLETPIESFF